MSHLSRSLRLVALGISLSALVVAGCNKHQDPPAAPPVTGVQASMVGDWHIDSVNTFFYNTDNSYRGMGVYVAQPDYYFHFQADHSWQESFTPDVVSGDKITGTYVLTSDSTFVLVNPAAIPKTDSIPSKILSLSQSSFVFSNRRVTTFNGTDPGYILYVFHLKK